jgi:enamine deaminase RidA (YjgF/YER057c/UK114 family)
MVYEMSQEEKPEPITDDLAKVLKEILNELKDINMSLKSIARSQAHLVTVQKTANIKRSEG